MGIVGEDMVRCTILTDEGLHIINPLYLCFRSIYIPKEGFIYVEYLFIPDPTYSLGGVKESIYEVILSDYWSIQSTKPRFKVSYAQP